MADAWPLNPPGMPTRQHALAAVEQRAQFLAAQCPKWRQRMASDPIPADVIANEILPSLIASREVLQAATGVPRILPYVADEKGLPSATIQTVFGQLLASFGSAISLIIAALPKATDSSGFVGLTIQSIAADGSTPYRSFEPEETSALRAALLNIEGLIAPIA